MDSTMIALGCEGSEFQTFKTTTEGPPVAIRSKEPTVNLKVWKCQNGNMFFILSLK